MSIQGISCTKKLLGDCGPDLQVEPGETITWELAIVNGSPEAHTLNVSDGLPSLMFLPADTTVTAVLTGGATAPAVAALPFSHDVVMPYGSKVVYTITATVPADVRCNAQVTNCAKIVEVTASPCPTEAKYVTAPTVQIVYPGTSTRDSLIPVGSGGMRDMNLNQLLWGFLGDNECDLNFLLDSVTNGLTLADVIRKVYA